jgi:hypothetical protein
LAEFTSNSKFPAESGVAENDEFPNDTLTLSTVDVFTTLPSILVILKLSFFAVISTISALTSTALSLA